jgi:threonine dehydrogenase-like Zn-dependent dehydrogenase
LASGAPPARRPVDFSTEDPVETIREPTGGVGVDRVIDAVGVDAYAPPGEGDDEARTAELEDVSAGGETAWNVDDRRHLRLVDGATHEDQRDVAVGRQSRSFPGDAPVLLRPLEDEVEVLAPG